MSKKENRIIRKAIESDVKYLKFKWKLYLAWRIKFGFICKKALLVVSI